MTTKLSINEHPTLPCVYIVLPALKISGGTAEALRLAQDIEASDVQVGTVSMWKTTQPMQQPAKLHMLSSWQPYASRAVFQIPLLAVRFRHWVRICGSMPCDWIFTHYSTLPLAMLIPRKHRWFFVQGLEWQFINNKIISKILQKLIFFAYRRSQLLVANSYLAESLEAKGLPVRAIAPIWANSCFAQDETTERDIDILMVLRKGGCKRFDLYKEALDWFAAQAPQLRIAVITTEDEIGALVRQKVTECHIRPGGQESMLKIYRRSRVFLLLSEHEGFGLPPLEAMGSGCVPLCRNSGGPQAYMRPPLDTLLLPLEMPLPDLCLRAVELLGDKTRWQNLSDAARESFQHGLNATRHRVHILASLFASRQNEANRN